MPPSPSIFAYSAAAHSISRSLVIKSRACSYILSHLLAFSAAAYYVSVSATNAIADDVNAFLGLLSPGAPTASTLPFAAPLSTPSSASSPPTPRHAATSTLPFAAPLLTPSLASSPPAPLNLRPPLRRLTTDALLGLLSPGAPPSPLSPSLACRRTSVAPPSRPCPQCPPPLMPSHSISALPPPATPPSTATTSPTLSPSPSFPPAVDPQSLSSELPRQRLYWVGAGWLLSQLL